MAVLNIREVPAEVAQSVKLQAMNAGVPLREWVIQTLAAACTARVVEEQPSSRKKERVRPSPARRSSAQRHPGAKNPAKKAPTVAIVEEQMQEAIAQVEADARCLRQLGATVGTFCLRKLGHQGKCSQDGKDG